MMPDATKEQADAFNELQRRTTSPECAGRYFETVGDFDIDDLLGQVNGPTLVMHVRGDLMNPFEKGAGWHPRSRPPVLWRCRATTMRSCRASRRQPASLRNWSSSCSTDDGAGGPSEAAVVYGW